MSGAQLQYFSRDGLQIAYRDSAPGNAQRAVVLLLHGFPDSSRLWRTQIAGLHARGFRAIAPDTRGCGGSGIAPALRDYRYPEILADHCALLDQLGIATADVVGHDWGAVFAWLLAAYHPDRVRRLATVSVGHPGAYAGAGWAQKRAGWYIGFFLMAGIAERALLGRGRFSFERAMPGHPDPAEVRERMRAPGRLTAALRVYRANALAMLASRHPKVRAPTLGIWSEGDRFLIEAQMRDSGAYVDNDWRYERLPGRHWIPLEQGEALSRLLLEHFGANTTTP